MKTRILALALLLTAALHAAPPTTTIPPVTISGNQTITGTKNFTGTLQIGGVSVTVPPITATAGAANSGAGGAPGSISISGGAGSVTGGYNGGASGGLFMDGGDATTGANGGAAGGIYTAGNAQWAGGNLFLNSDGTKAAGSINTQAGGSLTMGAGSLTGPATTGTIMLTSAIGSTVQAYDADLDDLADGSLSGSKVGSGINAANITTGVLAVANGGTAGAAAVRAKATSSQSVPANTVTTLVLDDETIDVGGNWASNAFTAPVTGWYLFSAYFNCSIPYSTQQVSLDVYVDSSFAVRIGNVPAASDNFPAGANVYLYVYKNGSLAGALRRAQTTTGPESALLTFSDRANGSSDYYEIWVSSDGAARSILTNTGFSVFTGVVIP